MIFIKVVWWNFTIQILVILVSLKVGHHFSFCFQEEITYPLMFLQLEEAK